MPGRPAGSRSSRTSAASTTRKTSGGVTKSTRASGARQSAHAVEIPDEGPVTSLRTKIAQVFSDAQKTTATQRKLAVHLRKIQEACCFEPPETGNKGGNKGRAEVEEDFDEEDFNNEMARCVLRLLNVKKSETAGDRVIRFLGLFLKHASEKDQAIFSAGTDEEGLVETPSTRLVRHIILTTMAFLTAREKTVRYRAAQTIAFIINNIATLDDDLYHLLRVGFIKRLRDKDPPVRVQAVLGLGTLLGDENEQEEDEDSDDDTAENLIEKLLSIMTNDPSAEVRRAVLRNLPRWRSTIKASLKRARDVDVTLRRQVYGKLLPTLGDFRELSVVDREKLLRWGLRDRDDIVRKATARLFSEKWLEECASSYDERPQEEKQLGEILPPNIVALCELLERIDVIRSGEDEEGIAHEAMKNLWEGRPDYLDYVSFDHDFWNDLDAQTSFIVRSLNDYAQNTEDASIKEKIEEKMPEVSSFAFILQKELRSLMEISTKALLLEEDDDPEEFKHVVEDLEETEFVVQQLLHIAKTLNYTDEIGRRQVYNITREAIAKAQLPEECTKLAIEVLRIVCGVRGESDFCALIVEAIAEVRDTLLDGDDDAMETGDEEEEESFHSAQSDVEGEAPLVKPQRANGKVLTEEEELERQTREVLVHSKCLHIAQCTLENVHCDLESSPHLTGILNTLIIPAVQAHEAILRERGVICLGLAALLSRDLASSNLDLFFHCFVKGHESLKEIVLQVLADILITHPQLLAPTVEDPDATADDAEPIVNPRLRPVTKILLKAFASDSHRLSLIACEAASKLLLLGILPTAPTAEILKAFVSTYFDPETAQNPALRQALSYFLPVYSHSKLKNAHIMAQMAVPIISKLLLIREEDIEEDDVDEMVGWPVITAHLAEWTDGRKVVGTTELGLDGKTSTSAEAEEPHIQLAIAVLERALTSTCTKDERKPLLSLLSKLHIAPSSSSSSSSSSKRRRHEDGGRADEEGLRELHGLVGEAVEGKIGADATQRNALAKLESLLTKRLGEVEVATQSPGAEDEEAAATTATEDTPEVESDATEVPETRTRKHAGVETRSVEPSVDGSEIGDDEDEEDTTMFAGMQGEGTRMPLEDEDEEEEQDDDDELPEGSTLTIRERRSVVTEDDIVESLLDSEI
ncbi:condensin complex component cnd3 [Plenodomus tracheiphilus IPT5]|uniref:Condensin complex component cnd3 n=1 Tax=Plenodomus tracheiphilus IPT5 TaxID=1408161 RepID=A0A6A7BC81_9PLEO|nr:condensin complex component cnd3 [Plenodomus tracheiphilus IPT5]